jgi:RecJ-like exonuclease
MGVATSDTGDLEASSGGGATVRCSTCDGTGTVEWFDVMSDCTECGGTGEADPEDEEE